MSLFRFDGRIDRIWAFAMMGLARSSMRRTPGLGFWKLCGSGTGEGFTPVPNTGVYAILATWPDEETARESVTAAPVYRRYLNRAAECWTIFLSPFSARGAWSGNQPFIPQGTLTGPVAVLTRATLTPSAALQFWRRVPDISAVIGSNRDVLFKIGIGEVPFLQQVTFSIWPDETCMAKFARGDGPHARAIQAVRQGGWFREELYARFSVGGDLGTWYGARPLEGLKEAA